MFAIQVEAVCYPARVQQVWATVHAITCRELRSLQLVLMLFPLNMADQSHLLPHQTIWCRASSQWGNGQLPSRVHLPFKSWTLLNTQLTGRFLENHTAACQINFSLDIPRAAYTSVYHVIILITQDWIRKYFNKNINNVHLQLFQKFMLIPNQSQAQKIVLVYPQESTALLLTTSFSLAIAFLFPTCPNPCVVVVVFLIGSSQRRPRKFSDSVSGSYKCQAQSYKLRLAFL